ncbi:DNA-binding protein [Bradyrhizobium sp. CB1717]|uniref:DNA-binding protein n=1 Tax=Bradyrhizobium sp. CB1717 TaxID=3039154 RepID=UPI0024B10E40|nr:DNA-binding protein [Bradyrhizobium sp. CB1717]WFU21913.1 DNA-binding protein [Bradyrhizobium sp. CB1717]
MQIPHDASPQIIWGARAIGELIGRSEKSTFAALEAGKLPGAKKVAGRWGLNPRIFFAAFENAA